MSHRKCMYPGCEDSAYHTQRTCLPHKEAYFLMGLASTKVCKAKNCQNRPKSGSKGLCLTHYRKDLERRKAAAGEFCQAPGCQRGAVRQKKWCDSHYGQMLRATTHTTSWYSRKNEPDMRLNNGKWESEHRVVMEEFLGRKLLRTEIVTHVDGNKKNNHPDNLRISTMKFPDPSSGLFKQRAPRLPARISQAEEFLNYYKPLEEEIRKAIDED